MLRTLLPPEKSFGRDGHALENDGGGVSVLVGCSFSITHFRRFFNFNFL